MNSVEDISHPKGIRNDKFDGIMTRDIFYGKTPPLSGGN